MRPKGLVINFVLLLALLGVAALQLHLIRQAKAHHRQLQSAVQQLNVVEPNIPEESEEVHAGKRELARLRNEVRQLRTQKPDLDRMRSENERLAARIADASKPLAPPTEEQGFVLRQNWAPAGFGSPEAAILTFFGALRDGDYQGALACMTPEEMKQAVDRRTQEIRPEVIKDLARLGIVPGLRIAARRAHGTDAFGVTDSFKIDVQSNPNGTVLTFDVRRIGNEWKVD